MERPMKILLMHNRYQQAGGEDTVVQSERDLLLSFGHDVQVLEVFNDTISTPLSRLQAGISAIYSPSARSNVESLIASFRPDIAHVHNFFPLLSPSVYDACRAYRVPVVQTLHNYRLVCPSATLYREGSPCQACLGKPIAWPGIVNKCYRSSRTQTTALATMLAVHRIRGTWDRHVDAFIALTSFQKDILIRGGLPEAKIHIKPNSLPDPGYSESRGPGDYAVFVGRLSPEKGLSTLLEAFKNEKISMPLKIVGNGPMITELQSTIIDNGLSGRVELLGHQDRLSVAELISKSRFLVLPSTWFEGFPMTILESFSRGIPVISSDIGGLSEIVNDQRNGWLAPPGDSVAWANTLMRAWSNPAEAFQYGQQARIDYDTLYSPDVNYRQLMEIYTSVRR